jgi:hypothetical protein
MDVSNAAQAQANPKPTLHLVGSGLQARMRHYRVSECAARV